MRCSDFVPLDEDVAGIWLPLGVSWVLVIIFIQPRLRLLKAEEEVRFSALYHFAAVAVLAAPTMIAQGYIRVASGGITHLKEVSEIAYGPATKHYSVDSLCLMRDEAIFEPVVRASGKNNQTLNFDVYALMPVCEQRDTGSRWRSIWIGQKFHESHSSSLSRSAAEARLAEFVRRSTAEFTHGDTKAFRYFERLGYNSGRKGFEEALRRVGIDVDASSSIVLIPHVEAYEDRTGNRLPWAFASFGIATVAWLVVVLLRPLDEERLKRWRDPGEPRNEELDDVRAVLIPTRESYALPLLLDINILVFVAMVMSGLGIVAFDRDDLLRWERTIGPRFMISDSCAWSAASLCTGGSYISSTTSTAC